MGQEVATTPIQLIAAFCALANGGDLLRPRVVRAVVRPDGKRLQVFDKPELVGRPVSKQTARFMVETVLRGVVDHGTGRRAQLADYSVFGKTGTAQKQAEAGGYAPGRHVSSFVAGAPVGHPEAVVLVVVNDPSVGKDHYGGEVAAPAVADILEKTLSYLRVAPDRDNQRPRGETDGGWTSEPVASDAQVSLEAADRCVGDSLVPAPRFRSDALRSSTNLR